MPIDVGDLCLQYRTVREAPIQGASRTVSAGKPSRRSFSRPHGGRLEPEHSTDEMGLPHIAPKVRSTRPTPMWNAALQVDEEDTCRGICPKGLGGVAVEETSMAPMSRCGPILRRCTKKAKIALVLLGHPQWAPQEN